MNNRKEAALQLTEFGLRPTTTLVPSALRSSSTGPGGSGHTELSAFTFPHDSSTFPVNSGVLDGPLQYHSRKRSSHEIDDLSVPRPSPPGRKQLSQTKGDSNRMSVSKDYPRRRALQACQICRARKTKCDNERPTCGNCEALEVECNYNEAPASKYSCRPCC